MADPAHAPPAAATAVSNGPSAAFAASAAAAMNGDPPASPTSLSTPDSGSRPLPHGSHGTGGGVVFPPTRTGSGGLNPRSCVTCRRRKVRCDKQQPCSNCVRQHIPCQFPAPGRAPRRPRKPPDGELLARLRKLEGVVQRFGANADDDPTEDDAGHALGSITDRGLTTDPMEIAGPSEERKRMLDYMVDHERKSLNSTSGRLVLDEGKSRYISNSFWANLSNEVEDIKSILHDDEDDDEADVTPPLSPEHGDESFIWSHPSPGHDLHQSHPPSNIVKEYWRVFEENVEPVMKLFHLPTMRDMIHKHEAKPGAAPRPFEALMFAVYYAAVTSLSPEQCQAIAGEPKTTVQPRYRHATERALARANFLRSEELIVLQAFVLFISSLRRNEDPRVLWTITGLLTRIAISMGLHRDPSLFGLSPFDTEIRRRLWWHICNLDVRLSEDHGSDPTILEHTFDTKLPLNINDDEFRPDMPSTTVDRKGITDMTFCLIRFEVANTFRRLSFQPPLTGRYHDKVHEVTVQDKQRWIEECHKTLEEKYLRYSDKNIPMHWVICTVGRLVLAKMWLSIYQPFQRLDGNACLPQQTRDQLFSTSIESIEYAMQLENEMSTMKWNWMFKSYSQWHAMAFLLNELCYRTKGPLVQRAWRAVDSMLEEWRERIPPHKRDHIWRPLRKLVAKARAARARELLTQKAQANRQNLNNNNNSGARINWDGEAFTMGPPWSEGNSDFDSNGNPRMVGSNEASDTSSNNANEFLPLTPNWANDIDTQMRSADAGADAEGNQNNAADLATTPFFANQPPAQWQAFMAEQPNPNTFLQDFFTGSSTFPPNRTGSLPNPSQQSFNPQGPRASLPTQPTPDMPAFAARNTDIAMQGSGQPGTAFAAGPKADPMLSGADMDVEGDVHWDDWDSMAREYELEAGQATGAPMGTGMTPAGAPGGVGVGGAGYFGVGMGGAGAGGGVQGNQGVGGRRPMLGENWF